MIIGGDGQDLLEMARKKRIEDLQTKVGEATTGMPAGDVAWVCIDRVMQIVAQENCPDKFKRSVAIMLTAATLEVLK